MSNPSKRKVKGFTLLEVLLVLAIASSLIVLMLNYTTQKSDEARRDKTVLQMQQILNSALSFYLNHSYWPLAAATATNSACDSPSWSDLSILWSEEYIPQNLKNSYGNSFSINCKGTTGNFFISTIVRNPADAAVIAGRLPMGFVAPTNASGFPLPTNSCSAPPYASNCLVVVSSVSIPGQNLNNARSVNFAGVYNNGACVPAPNCPPGMKAAIFVAPISVAGVVDPPSCTNSNNPSTCSATASPISSFIAFARGTSIADPSPAVSTGSGSTLQSNPLDCSLIQTPQTFPCNSPSYSSLPASDPAGTKYWRVCLAVFTQKGEAYPAITEGDYIYDHGKLIGSVMALTRCVPNNGTESPSGSPISVWTPNQNSQP